MSNEITITSKNATPMAKDRSPRLGQWYWVKEQGNEEPWFGCIMKIGSNFVELHSPYSNNGYSYTRVHFDDFFKYLSEEENPKQVLKEKIEYWQQESKRLLLCVQNLVSRLGLNQRQVSAENPEEMSTSLVVVSGKEDLGSYKKD